ncbi:MAG: hypothetical protein HRT53_14870 [Colwellia sp.]|nr:hypothetical protein [Colwellia sp.]
MKHFFIKFILLLSAVLSVNSALAVPLSSVIDSDIQQVEYRQTPTYTSLNTLSVAKVHFQLAKNDSYKKQFYLASFICSHCFSKGLLGKLTATRVKQDYQQQIMTMLTFSSKPQKLLFKLVSHQTENQPSHFKKHLS